MPGKTGAITQSEVYESLRAAILAREADNLLKDGKRKQVEPNALRTKGTPASRHKLQYPNTCILNRREGIISCSRCL